MRPNVAVCVHIFVFLRKFGLQISSSGRGPKSLPYSGSRKKKIKNTDILHSNYSKIFRLHIPWCSHQ